VKVTLHTKLIQQKLTVDSLDMRFFWVKFPSYSVEFVLVVEIQTHPTRGSREDGERLWSQIGNATKEILEVPV